jgi:hypothetical protein
LFCNAPNVKYYNIKTGGFLPYFQKKVKKNKTAPINSFNTKQKKPNLPILKSVKSVKTVKSVAKKLSTNQFVLICAICGKKIQIFPF